MTTSTAGARHQHHWVLAICPITQAQVMGHIQRGFYIPEDRDVWWHCPTCEGWHVLTRHHAGLAAEVEEELVPTQSVVS